MLRTWRVRLLAIRFTDSVRSFQMPDDARHPRLTAQPALGAHLAGHPGHLVAERRQLVDHRVDGRLQLQDLARARPRRSSWTGRRGRPRWSPGDVAHLAGQVGRHAVHRLGEVLPRARTPGTRAWPPRMPSVPTSRATRVTSSPNADSVSTIVLMVSASCGDLAPRLDGDLLGQVAVGDGGGDRGDRTAPGWSGCWPSG